ncbi:MAG TPA: SagB/ThcOx family dehydrogenase [Candidatus Omnitrophota bacterium]|nr:SagB/ThcOx family dehydrogenase [Candidatus Omnitrophota bacterium]
MTKTFCILSLILIPALFIAPDQIFGEEKDLMNLPEPRLKGNVSVEEAINNRRSVRNYAPKKIDVASISQLLWAAQGITDKSRGFRSTPSAGALYPLEIYLVKDEGIYHYIPDGHKLELVSDKNVKKALVKAAHNQAFISEADIDIIVCGVYERAAVRYGDRAVRYTDMEAGHLAQNVFLQAIALGLDSVAIGAFSDSAVSEIVGLPKNSKPLYILPVGYKK